MSRSATGGGAQPRGIVGLAWGECDLLHRDTMAKPALLGLALLIGCSNGGRTGAGGAGGTGGTGGMSGTGGAATCTGTVLFSCVASCGEPHEAVICDGGHWGCPLGSIRSDACPTGGTSGSAGTTGAGGGGGASGSAGAGGGAGVGGSGPRGGAGGGAGRGGAGGRGGGGGVGGSPCGPPPSHPTFNCAPTYDEQAAVTGCGLGGSVTKGACGAAWGWRCQSVYTLTCIYDSQKNLAADRWCPNVGACSASCPSVIGFDTCIDDISRPTDAGAGN